MFNGGEDIGAIVMDIGFSSTKVGFAGEDSPRCWIPTSIGVEGDHQYVGKQELLHHPTNVEIKNPIKDGLIHDWDMIEKIVEYACKNSLKVNTSDHPFLIGEPSFNRRVLREKYTELMFEKYDVPAVFLSKNSVLNCFANGRTTGLVVDIGGGTTAVTPVHEGYVLQKFGSQSPLAGDLLDKSLFQRLKDMGLTIRAFSEIDKKLTSDGSVSVSDKCIQQCHSSYIDFFRLDVVQNLKETVCRVSEVPFDEAANAQIPKIPYELPDGTTVEMGTERFSVPEMLFANTPKEEKVIYPTLQNMVCDSVLSCEVDVRRDLFHNIILTGGSSCFENMQFRLEKEVTNIAPSLFKTKVIASHSAERKVGAWIGGSILGSLGSFHEMWMSKSEYAEHGAGLVERKCP